MSWRASVTAFGATSTTRSAMSCRRPPHSKVGFTRAWRRITKVSCREPMGVPRASCGVACSKPVWPGKKVSCGPATCMLPTARRARAAVTISSACILSSFSPSVTAKRKLWELIDVQSRALFTPLWVSLRFWQVYDKTLETLFGEFIETLKTRQVPRSRPPTKQSCLRTWVSGPASQVASVKACWRL